MNINPVHSDLPLTKTSQKEAKKYPFIDFIRFISMMGIVWAHTEAFPFNSNYFNFLKENGHVEYYIFFKQIFKFSVFCFFMISGFLLGDKITDVSPLSYLKKRIQSTLRPYIISLVLFMVVYFFRNIFFRNAHYSLISAAKETVYIIIGTPYWFIPTFFVSLIVILLFIKYVDSYLFGAFLFVITLLFTFPIELNTQHVIGPNTVFFGYIFYIWLGIFIRRKNLIEHFKKLNPYFLLVMVIVFFIASSLESLWLFNRDEHLFFNILRLTNQLYGIFFFIFLVRICPEKTKFGFFNPRKETYGIYLYHFFFVVFLFPFVYKWFMHYTTWDFNNTFTVIGLSVIHFILCYLITTLWVKLLLKLKIPVL